MIKYFILKSESGHPTKIVMGIYKDSKKFKGHPFLPNELKPTTKCYDSLQELRNVTCGCPDKYCQYNYYLAKAINQFTKETFHA